MNDPGPASVSPADTREELAYTIRRYISLKSMCNVGEQRAQRDALVAVDALLAVGERDKAEREQAVAQTQRIIEKSTRDYNLVVEALDLEREARQQAEERGERDRQHIARLAKALDRLAQEVENECRGRPSKQRLRHRVTLARQDLAAVLAGEEDAEPERQVAEGYATGMRESRPNVCWRLLDGGDWCCILDRGHDGGIHEPGRAAGEEDAGGGGSQTCVCESGTRDTDTSGTVADTSPSARAAGEGDT